MNSPLVSIVTPSLNRGPFIEETIRSVMDQDYPNIEHIVVDGGSEDETPEILERYRSHIRCICEPDECLADAMNKGLLASQGEIICWLNADDTLVDRKSMTRVVAGWERYPEADVIYFDILRIDGDGQVEFVVSLPKFSLGRLRRGCYIFQSATFVRTSVARQNPLNIDFKLGQDYELWLRLATKGYNFKHVPEVISTWRIHPMMRSITMEDAATEENRIIWSSYGLPTVWTTELWRWVSKLSTIPRRFRALCYALTLPWKRDWAFDAKIDMPRLLWRQLH